MKEFDVNNINFEKEDDDNNHELAELLTGEYIKGLSEYSEYSQNAELEGDEYLQFPSGDTYKAKGLPHSKGGMKMNIPDGTMVVSKTLTLTGEQSKFINKRFDIDVTAKDSYAKVIDKYVKEIGLEKLYEEQEHLIERLQALENNTTIDVKTKDINKNYLAEKIAKIEKDKQPLEVDKKRFFKQIFDMQESTKSESSTGDDVFKLGGISQRGLNAVANKLGIDADTLINVSNNVIQKYEGGGKFKSKARANTFSDQTVYTREHQEANPDTYGKTKDPKTVVLNLYQNFPDIIAKEEVFGKYIDIDTLKSKGEVVFKNSPTFNKEQETVLKMQELVDGRMKSSAETIIKNKDLFDQETYDLANKYLKEETFTGAYDKGKPLEERVRSYDKKLGNFTSGRFALGLDLVQPSERDALNRMGITTLNQITDEQLKTLSPETQDRIKQIKNIQLDNSDFFLDTYGEPAANPNSPAKTVQQKPTTNPDPNAGIVDYAKDYQVKPYQPKMFYQPDQRTLPPSPLEIGTMIEQRFQRIDPVRIGIDQNLQEASNAQQMINDQLRDLPMSQRAAALASILATSQEGVNKAIVTANQANAQNQASTELFNVGQSDKEEMARAQNMLSFEQRALTAKSNTEEDIRRFYDHNMNVNINNFQNQQQLNLLDAMTPDYDLNFMGTGVEYNPSYYWKLYADRLGSNNEQTVSPDDLTLKAAREILEKNPQMKYKLDANS